MALCAQIPGSTKRRSAEQLREARRGRVEQLGRADVLAHEHRHVHREQDAQQHPLRQEVLGRGRVEPGLLADAQDPKNRNVEYDAFDDRLVTFLLTEIIPQVAQRYAKGELAQAVV